MRKLAYPDDRRVSTLKSGGEGRIVVGNYGKGRRYDALIRIDIDAPHNSLNFLMNMLGRVSHVDLSRIQ